jgi:hypothetical protein
MLHEAQRMSAPKRLQGLDQHRRLDGHVQRPGDARALERLLLAVLGAQRHEPRHLGLGDGESPGGPSRLRADVTY